MAKTNEPASGEGAEALRDRWIPRTRVIARRERAAREAERKEKRSEDAGS